MDPLDSISRILHTLSEIAEAAPSVLPLLEDFVTDLGAALKDRKVSLGESLRLGGKGFAVASAVIKAAKAAG